MLRQFHVVFEKDDDRSIVVECLDLPGCVSQGRTEDEALANIREAIQASVETRLAHHLVPMVPASVGDLPPHAHFKIIAVDVPA
jgi:predicted RNase H-like HicB family nuclease